METITMKVEEILKLETVEDSRKGAWLNLEIFENEFDIDIYSISSDKAKEKLHLINKMDDSACNDDRGRSLEIMYYEDIPFMIFQDNGKGGSYTNMFIINKPVFREAIKFLSLLAIEEQWSEYDIADINTEIEVTSYNLAPLELKDNKLIAKKYIEKLKGGE